MAIEILDEHEQGEAVRRWLRQYGGSLVGGVVLGIAALIGVQQWQSYGVERKAEAAARYQDLSAAFEARDLDLAETLANELRERAGATPFAALAALRQAEAAVSAGELEGALAALSWVADSAREPALADLARLRAARVQLALGDAEGALSSVDGVKAVSYAGLAAELRGDALVALGRPEEALAAYRQGLEGEAARFAARDVLNLKIDSLGVAAAASEGS